MPQILRPGETRMRCLALWKKRLDRVESLDGIKSADALESLDGIKGADGFESLIGVESLDGFICIGPS